MHVRLGAIRSVISSAKSPGALVGVLIAAIVVPGVQIRIGDRFLQLVRDDGSHAIRSGVAVRSSGLLLARARAAVRISDECVLDVRARNGAVSVPAAILRAESG